ncbi:hypothetical protein BI350_07525 [Sporosarcina ureilytica]|uniref:DUF2508 domain-containing protein n=2 Tax=Sporosarcina ureilytica TaxID=298596 RepID=A0A1D8JFB7_9BACL|nr:hypothetical protein BI350_07525 [Sporosarcina ureilytica]
MIKEAVSRKSKLKRIFDDRLRSLMTATRDEWEQAKVIENHLDDYDQEVFIRRKITESKHFYLYKEAKARNLGRD